MNSREIKKSLQNPLTKERGKMTTQKHTPLMNCNIIQENGKFYQYLDGFSRKEVGMEFIIRAVNSHYELLEACKSVINWSPNGLPETLINDIKKAIQKVEGK